MYRLLPLVAACLFFTSCVHFVQVCYVSPVKPETIKTQDSRYVYENDTLSVVYYFWNERGIMAFLITNKLNIPLYIDWKKASFVNQGEKLNYYTDKTIVKSHSVSATAGTNYYRDWFGPLYLSANEGNATLETEERITFIPPHTQYARSQFKILPNVENITMDAANKVSINPAGTKATFTGREIVTDKDNSRITFRNFFTYSTKENFDNEKYVDNAFYVRKVLQVPYHWFSYYSHGEQRDYSDPTRFYLGYIVNYVNN